MKPPIFVRELSEKERKRLKAGLRSRETFVMRRSQILLASARGLSPPKMAAEAAFEAGLTQRRVSGETIRATLSRLLGIRWMRAKRWITPPDPLYERKKGGAIG